MRPKKLTKLRICQIKPSATYLQQIAYAAFFKRWIGNKYRFNLDDIFTIDNPEFEKHIPGIYLTELQLNKVNTSDKTKSFVDIQVIDSDIHTSVYNKRDEFGCPTVNFHWLSGDVPIPRHSVVNFNWLDLLGVALAF